MRKIKILEHISLDGVIQGPGAPKEDSSGGFAYGGWAAPHDDPEGERPLSRLMATISICSWAAEPTISLAAFGQKLRRVRWRIV